MLSPRGIAFREECRLGATYGGTINTIETAPLDWGFALTMYIHFAIPMLL